MNKYTKKTYILIILCLLPIITHAKLSLEFKMEQLIREAKISFNQKSYSKTLSIFKEIYALNSKIPPSARYMLAETYYKNKQFYNAKIEFEKYVNQTGKNGRFFKNAINRIAKINVMPWRDRYGAYNSNVYSEAEAAAWRGDFERLERLNKLNPKTLSNNKVISQLTKANNTKGLFFLLNKKIYLGNNRDAINKIKKIIAVGDFDTLHKITSLSPDIYHAQNSNNELFGLPEIQNTLLYEQGAKGYKFLTKADNIGYAYTDAPVKAFLKSKIQKHDFSVLNKWVKNDSYILHLDYVLHEILDVFRVPGLLYLLKKGVDLDPVKSRIATYLNGLLEAEDYTQLKKYANFSSSTIRKIIASKEFANALLEKNERIAAILLIKACGITNTYSSSRLRMSKEPFKYYNESRCQSNGIDALKLANRMYNEAAESNDIQFLKEIAAHVNSSYRLWEIYYRGFNNSYADIAGDEDEEKELINKNIEYIRYAQKKGGCSLPKSIKFDQNYRSFFGNEKAYEYDYILHLFPAFKSCTSTYNLLTEWPWVWLLSDVNIYTSEKYLAQTKQILKKKNDVFTPNNKYLKNFFKDFFKEGKIFFDIYPKSNPVSKIKPTVEFYCSQIPIQKKRSVIQKEAVSLGACEAVDFPLDVFKTYMASCKPELENTKCDNKPILSTVKNPEKRKILIEFGTK